MSGTTQARGERPQLLETLSNDVRVVAEDIWRRGFTRSIGGTLSGLEQFYLSREERQRLAELRGVRRFIRRIWWFLRGLLMKLTPARRILLAFALVSFFMRSCPLTDRPRVNSRCPSRRAARSSR